MMGLDYSPGARFARVFLDKEIPDGPVTVSNEYLANGSEFGMETDPDSELKDTAVEVGCNYSSFKEHPLLPIIYKLWKVV